MNKIINDTVLEEAVFLTFAHYDGLQIPFVENQSWWPSHPHQSTKNKNWEIITGSPVSWLRKLIKHFGYKASVQSNECINRHDIYVVK